MLNFCSLYSGSSGNSLFVETENTKLLIDAGVSSKKIENAIVEIKSGKKTVKYKIFVIYIVIIVLVIAVLAVALVPWSRDQDQVVPMEEMYTGPDDGYAEGTFTIQ